MKIGHSNGPSFRIEQILVDKNYDIKTFLYSESLKF